MTGEILLKIEYRPGGEFVEGGVSNVQHRSHVGITASGKLDLKNFPAAWKAMFKEAGISKHDIKHNNDAVVRVMCQFGLLPKSLLASLPPETDDERTQSMSTTGKSYSGGTAPADKVATQKVLHHMKRGAIIRLRLKRREN